MRRSSCIVTHDDRFATPCYNTSIAICQGRCGRTKTQETARPGPGCAAPQTPFASKTLTWTESDAPSCSTVHAAPPTWTQSESKPSFPPASGGFGGMARDRANLRGTAVLPHTTEGCGEQTLHPPEKGTTRTEAIRAERFFKARQIRRQSRILSMICRAIGRILASTLAARLVACRTPDYAYMSPLQKGYFTAETQRSQRKMPERAAPAHHASPRIHFVFEVLCALGVSAVRFCSEVIYGAGQRENQLLLRRISWLETARC